MLNIVFGGAGFIGSNLCYKLIAKGDEVVVVDNFSLGSRHNLKSIPDENIVIGDINLLTTMKIVESKFDKKILKDALVWHLAANSDILAGVEDLQVDCDNTLLTTFNILQFMRRNDITKLNFASSSAIYGDKENDMVTEDAGNLQPISMYGACKLSSEALISAARESFLEKVSIFRFPNVVGAPATHGVIFDFLKKLKVNPQQLDVLGDGTQTKAYLHVDDLVCAMLFINASETTERIGIFNIGNGDQGAKVSEIAKMVVDHMGGKAEIKYGSEDRGWVGDVAKFRFNVEKIKKLGWKPKMTSQQAVQKAIREIAVDVK